MLSYCQFGLATNGQMLKLARKCLMTGHHHKLCTLISNLTLKWLKFLCTWIDIVYFLAVETFVKIDELLPIHQNFTRQLKVFP